LQVGVGGYLQRQTTAKTGAGVTEEESRERYAINALGVVAGIVRPHQHVNVGVKVFEEFANRAAHEGLSRVNLSKRNRWGSATSTVPWRGAAAAFLPLHPYERRSP
jgi:hypothetical protein